ncbi:MAG: glycosyltransferase [Chloroflexi bacterium]|nr:glycosyltransferase [Chloroflexota bacterium]NOH10463.1 glycosyltransferase [Chloroflexota bacterium]
MPRITFGIIALNAQPFLEYNLRALYSFAHQIIVVEGAVEAARSMATPEGHSTDGTYEMLKRFREVEDPEGKLVLVTAEDEGTENRFWEEKDAMSQAYASRATGDWLWQVDSDEFYFAEDIEAVCKLLDRDSEISTISFPYREFWGGFDYIQRGRWYDYEHPAFHRLFRWGENYTYSAHRPPTVLDQQGRDLRTLKCLDHQDMKRRGIYLHHYSYVFPKQAEAKVGYYSHVNWTDAFRNNQRWLEDSYYGLKAPLHIGERQQDLQWLERYTGPHPGAIQQMREDIAKGRLEIEVRDSQDIEVLLHSPTFRVKRRLAAIYLFAFWHARRFIKPITRFIRRTFSSQEQT